MFLDISCKFYAPKKTLDGLLFSLLIRRTKGTLDLWSRLPA